jgi:hypothetical protein
MVTVEFKLLKERFVGEGLTKKAAQVDAQRKATKWIKSLKLSNEELLRIVTSITMGTYETRFALLLITQMLAPGKPAYTTSSMRLGEWLHQRKAA